MNADSTPSQAADLLERSAKHQPLGRPLIGRHDELGRLAQALDAALSRRGILTLLSGEAGVGKTRLAEAAAELAVERGFVVAWGRCWEGGGAPAWWAWWQALTILEEALAPRLRAHPQGGPEGAASADVLSAFRPLEAAVISEEIVRSEQIRLVQAVTRWLVATSEQWPLVIILEDLHAADTATLRLLSSLVPVVRSARVVILGTYRELEVAPSSEVQAQLSRLASEAFALRLTRLGRDDTLTLAQALGCSLSAASQEALWAATGGNPLFAGELARLLKGRPVVASAEPLPLPGAVREVLRHRLLRLDASTRQLLAVAAVLGDDMRVTDLLEVVERAPEDVRARLEEAQDLGIVTRLGERRIAFAHGLMREVLYRDLPVSERARWHGRYLAVLERIQREHGEVASSRLAFHAVHAGPDAVEGAVHWSIAAADEALAVLAVADAETVLGRAEEALELGGRDTRLRTELLLARGRVATAAGAVDEARRLCARATELARRLADPFLLARSALGYGAELIFAVVSQDLIARLREALDALPDEEIELRARLMARLAAAMQPAFDPSVPVALAREALGLLETSSPPAVRLEVIHNAIGALIDYVDPAERIPLNTQAVTLATALSDTARLVRARTRLVCDHLESGDLFSAEAELVRLESDPLAARLPRHRWGTVLLRASSELRQARFDRVEALTAEAVRLADETADPRALAVVPAWKLASARVREDPEAIVASAFEMASRLATIPDTEPFAIFFEVGARARLGDLPSTRALLDQIDLEAPFLSSEPILASFVCDAIAFAGDAERAATFLSRVSKLAHRVCFWGTVGLAWEGHFSRCLGLLARVTGNLDAAVAHHETALQFVEPTDAISLLPRLRYELSVALLARARTGDRERAVTEQGRARRQAEGFGMSTLVALLDRDQAAAPGSGHTGPPPGPTASPPAVPPFTIGRDGSLWRVDHGAKSFHLRDLRGLQILDRLVSSPDQELHVLDLVGGGGSAIDRGDAGELLDEAARAAYRGRAEDLRDQLEEAEELGDIGRAERAREELDLLAGELARAFGLGGRARRAGNAAERARTAVQRRVRDAIQRIAEHAPELADHLDRSIQTGLFCSYRPLGRFG